MTGMGFGGMDSVIDNENAMEIQRRTVEQQAHEAAIEHGEWLPVDADETNFEAYVAGFKKGHASRDARHNEAIRLLRKWLKSGQYPVTETKTFLVEEPK